MKKKSLPKAPAPTTPPKNGSIIEDIWTDKPLWRSDKIPEVDPFEKPFWNEMQTLAWIHVRKGEVVNLFDDDITDWGSYQAMGVIPGGETQLMEFSRKRPDTIAIEMWGVEYGAMFDNVEKAKAEINKMLSRGKLTCLGVVNNEGDPQEISSMSWADLKIDYDKGIAHPLDLLRQGATKWHNLKFRSADLAKIWPKKSGEVIRTIKAENECKIWLKGLMANGADKEHPKDHYRNEAIKKFGVGKNAFNRAWADTIYLTRNSKWNKGGRPKKKN